MFSPTLITYFVCFLALSPAALSEWYIDDSCDCDSSKHCYLHHILLTSQAQNVDGSITKAAQNAYGMVQAANQIVGSEPTPNDGADTVWVFPGEQSMNLAARIFGASNSEKECIHEGDDPLEASKFSFIKGSSELHSPRLNILIEGDQIPYGTFWKTETISRTAIIN